MSIFAGKQARRGELDWVGNWPLRSEESGEPQPGVFEGYFEGTAEKDFGMEHMTKIAVFRAYAETRCAEVGKTKNVIVAKPGESVMVIVNGTLGRQIAEMEAQGGVGSACQLEYKGKQPRKNPAKGKAKEIHVWDLRFVPARELETGDDVPF